MQFLWFQKNEKAPRPLKQWKWERTGPGAGRGAWTGDEVGESAPRAEGTSAQFPHPLTPASATSAANSASQRPVTRGPHPGTRALAVREGAGPPGPGLLWLAASGALSPPRGQVRPSRDALRPGRSGLQRVCGAEAAAAEFAARVGDPVSSLVSISLSLRSSLDGPAQASTCRTTTW